MRNTATLYNAGISHFCTWIFIAYLSINALSAQEISDANKALLDQADSLVETGVVYSDAFKSDTAFSLFRQAFKVYIQAGDTTAAFKAKISEAKEYGYTGNFGLSEDLLDSIILSSSHKRQIESRHEAYREKGYVLLSQGKLSQALEALDSAKKFNYQVESEKGLSRSARVSFLKAFAYLYLNELEKSESHFEFSQKVYTQIGDRERLAETLNHFGSLKAQLMRPDEAIPMYKRSMALYKELEGGGDVTHIASLYNSMGTTYRLLDMKAYAIQSLQSAASIYRKISPQHYNLAIVFAHLADTYNSIGEPEKALPYIRDALATAQRSFNHGDNDFRITQNSFVLGTTLHQLGRDKEALEVYNTAIDNLQEALPGQGTQWIAALRYDRGLSIISLGPEREEYAVNEMKAGINMFIQMGFSQLRNAVQRAQGLASYYLEEEAYDSALTYFNTALNIQYGQPNQDFPNPQLAFHLRRRELLLGKAKAFESKYRQDQKKEWLDSAYKAMQQARQEVAPLSAFPKRLSDKLEIASGLAESNNVGIRVCYELYQLTGNKQYADYAYQLIGQSKSGRKMFSFDINSDYSLGVPDSVLWAEKSLHVALSNYETLLYQELENPEPNLLLVAEYEAKLSEITQQVIEQSQTIRSKYPGYYQLKFSPEQPGIEWVQRELLRADEILINYHFDQQTLYAIYVDQKGFRFQKTALSEDFNHHLKGMINSLRKPDISKQSLDQYVKSSLYLKKALLSGLNQDFQGVSLLIIPDQNLFLLPFEILITEQPIQSAGFKDLPYLFKQYNIRYSTSTYLLANQLETKGTKVARLVAFAPVFSTLKSDNQVIDTIRSGLSNLPFTKEEVESIANHYEVKTYIDSAATEKEFRRALSEDYSVIHIASHAMVDENNALYSKILFSPFETDSINDSYLNTREVLDLYIPADMVVLSACNTGTVDMNMGSGIMSMANGFFFAGAKNLVMSLWTANDQSTAQLMDLFYKNLTNGLSKSEALRTARNTYLQSANKITAHPYYWAHFVVNGDDRPLKQASNTSYLWFVLLIPIAFLLIRKAQTRPTKS